jgi:predicted NUDIX family NTP pyrophosphohydrolase
MTDGLAKRLGVLRPRQFNVAAADAAGVFWSAAATGVAAVPDGEVAAVEYKFTVVRQEMLARKRYRMGFGRGNGSALRSIT